MALPPAILGVAPAGAARATMRAPPETRERSPAMSDQIRVGVVGTSGYADFMHLPSLKSHPRAAISAICGRNTERARELADKYGAPEVFGDWRALIAGGGLDALVVAAPDDLHAEITRAGLEAGLHVLCEKPLALN